MSRNLELDGALEMLAEKAEHDVDAALSSFVYGRNTALATSGLTLHRKFALTERGLVRITKHADRTRRRLKREADRIRRERAH